jgi:hypothetical protein
MNVDFSTYPTNTLLFLVREISREIKSRKHQSAAPTIAQQRAKRRADFVKALKPEQPDKRDAANAKLIALNSASLLSVVGISGPLHERGKYLPALIKQNWSHIYPRDAGDRKFYVYVHVDPGAHCFVTTKECGGSYKGLPFYVGKGTGARAYDLKRNQGHGKKIKSVLDAGFMPNDIVHVPFKMLTEAEAYEIEAKLIYFFRTVYQAPKSGTLYNLDVPRFPDFQGQMYKYFSSREIHKMLESDEGSVDQEGLQE